MSRLSKGRARRKCRYKMSQVESNRLVTTEAPMKICVGVYVIIEQQSVGHHNVGIVSETGGAAQTAWH